MRALSEKRLSDYMAQQIADEILSGRIVGGTQLKQEELAEVFGASRIPIREAFQVLEGQGLIVRLATRRIYAVELSEEQIQIIYEMIGDILKKAVENLKNEDRRAVETAIHRRVQSRRKSMSYGQAAWWKEMWIHTMQIPTLCIVTSRH